MDKKKLVYFKPNVCLKSNYFTKKCFLAAGDG